MLELGGGDGFQAMTLASWGLQVDSVDLPDVADEARWFAVRAYDGRALPFADGTFDFVFSSNVLEHIADLPTIFRELRRVARRDALHVHVLPSPKWRFWTSAAHYPYLFRRFVLRRPDETFEISMPHSVGDALRRRGVMYSIRRALVAPPHGEYSSSIAELYYYSVRRWLAELRRNGFDVVEHYAAGVFYTGYGLAPGISVASRRRMASLLGSACNVFVMRSAN